MVSLGHNELIWRRNLEISRVHCMCPIFIIPCSMKLCNLLPLEISIYNSPSNLWLFMPISILQCYLFDQLFIEWFYFYPVSDVGVWWKNYTKSSWCLLDWCVCVCIEYMCTCMDIVWNDFIGMCKKLSWESLVKCYVCVVIFTPETLYLPVCLVWYWLKDKSMGWNKKKYVDPMC